MSKLKISPNIFIYPMPVTLLGTKNVDKANFMALGWITRINANPPLLAIGVNKTHLSNQKIKENKCFSINFPNQEMIVETDFCGLVSGKNRDKSEIFTVFYGELKDAPMIEESPLSMECKLVDVHELATNDLFIGEIINVYTEKEYLTDSIIDIKKINPLLLTMPDNQYWSVGENLGKAWNIGKKLKK